MFAKNDRSLHSGILICLAGSCSNSQGLILIAGSVSKSYLSPFTYIRKALKCKESHDLEYFFLNDDRENTLW